MQMATTLARKTLVLYMRFPANIGLFDRPHPFPSDNELDPTDVSNRPIYVRRKCYD